MFEAELKRLKQAGLLRAVKDRSCPQGRLIALEGGEYLNFSSNDYLGLANHPHVIMAAKEALDGYGSGAGASRLLSGGTDLHGRLEARLASLKGAEAALIFNSGYSANTGIIPALTAGSGSTEILSDELNHASIIDGCRLSGAKTLVYGHKDMGHLKALLKGSWAERKIVITDTVFSMDGDLAPLGDICALCKDYGALLYLDDAHGTGVMGQGRGALSHFGIKPEPWIIQMGTFSKALGSFGAFVAAPKDVTDWLINKARSFMFSTALPPPVVAASLAALELIENDKGPLERLWENRNSLFEGLKALGLNTGLSESPIIPVIVKEAAGLSEGLFKEGIYAPAIRPPTVKEPRLRLTVTASHTPEDVSRLIGALKRR